MREILFRAKRKDNGEWIFGYYCKYGYNHCIIEPTDCSIAKGIGIVPETLCQFTGLTDKNVNKVFTGDIVKFLSSYYVVKLGYYKDYYCCPACMETIYGFYLDNTTSTISVSFDFSQNYELVGNIIDNPELLEQEKR